MICTQYDKLIEHTPAKFRRINLIINEDNKIINFYYGVGAKCFVLLLRVFGEATW